MIDIKVKVHDNYSFEFKTSFIAKKKSETNETSEFSINTWLFFPNSVDINRNTYSKDEFYKDTKSNVRLITPIYTLKEIYQGEDTPLIRVKEVIRNLASANDKTNEEIAKDYIFQIRMFCSILKSASRDRAYFILEQDDDSTPKLIEDYINDIRLIITQYRSLKVLINQSTISEDDKQSYIFGDMFIGNILEQQTYRLMRGLSKRNVYKKVNDHLYNFVNDEDSYKKHNNYSTPNPADNSNNYLTLMRRSILKKFIENDLFLITKKSKDGALAEQMYYALAAGISMIFATVISFSAQLHYGNFTVPLFFALVISYAFKDRIKDLMRYYFSTQLGKKYFDTKQQLDIQKEPIGWTKEAFDFVSEAKVPPEVLNLRQRTPLVEAENKLYNEQIILYRKLVHLESSKLNNYRGYQFIGINDITRFNIMHYILKLDNPKVPIFMPDAKNGYTMMSSEKVYTLYFILRCEGSEDVYYRKFRILFNREGIKEVTEIRNPD